MIIKPMRIVLLARLSTKRKVTSSQSNDTIISTISPREQKERKVEDLPDRVMSPAFPTYPTCCKPI